MPKSTAEPQTTPQPRVDSSASLSNVQAAAPRWVGGGGLGVLWATPVKRPSLKHVCLVHEHTTLSRPSRPNPRHRQHRTAT